MAPFRLMRAFESWRKRDWAPAAIMALAFAARLLWLSLKPPHADEGVNGWFVDQMLVRGYYAYDPANYHGPLHFYALLAARLIFGRSLWALRLPGVFFGAAAVYLIARLRPYVGLFAAYSAALFAAVSPGMIYYSRDAIHESALLFFSLLAFLGFLRHGVRRDSLSLWQVSLGLAGMIATKETFIIHAACFALAWLAALGWQRRWPGPGPQEAVVEAGYGWRQAAAIAGAGGLLVVLLYTGFGRYPAGLANLFKSFSAWYNTGQKGGGHDKPFFYWMSLLYRYEWPALLGLILTLRLARPAGRWLRLIGLYGLLQLFLYSAIHYKTPWCLINLLWPFMVVAGAVLEETSLAVFPGAAYGALAALALASGGKAWSLNVSRHSQPAEPYAYVQTLPDVMEALAPLEAAAAADASRRRMPIKVYMEGGWPLPWLLGQYSQVDWIEGPAVFDPDAAVVFSDARHRQLVEEGLTKKYFTRVFRLRPGLEESVAYFDAGLFRGLFAPEAPLFKPTPPRPLPPGQGLRARFYGNAEWAGTPVMERRVAQPGFRWEDGRRPMAAPFGIVYSGELFVAEAGVHDFTLSSDDGSDLFIDGKRVIDNLGPHAERAVTKTATLSRGWHRLRLRYQDFGGWMVLTLSWKRPGGVSARIEPDRLRRGP